MYIIIEEKRKKDKNIDDEEEFYEYFESSCSKCPLRGLCG